MRFPDVQKLVDSRLNRGLGKKDVEEMVGKITGQDGKLSKVEQKQLAKVADLYGEDFTTAGKREFEKLTGIELDRPEPARGSGRTVGVSPWATRLGGGRGRRRIFSIMPAGGGYGPRSILPTGGGSGRGPISILPSGNTGGGRIFSILPAGHDDDDHRC